MGAHSSKLLDRMPTGMRRRAVRNDQLNSNSPAPLNIADSDVNSGMTGMREPVERIAQLNSNSPAPLNIAVSDVYLGMPELRKRVDRIVQLNSYSPAPLNIGESDVYSSPTTNSSSVPERGRVQYDELPAETLPDILPRTKPPTVYNRNDSTAEYLEPREGFQLPQSYKAATSSVYNFPKSDLMPKVRAKRNYEATYDSDISLIKGDILELVHKHEVDEWFYGRNVVTGEAGYVPKDLVTMIADVDIESHSCFFKKTGRAEAEVKLQEPGIDPGTYLIRRSEGGDYALSVRCENESGELEIKHYKIRVDEMGVCYVLAKSDTKPFGNILDLIRHYTVNPDLQCKLKEPLPREITLDDHVVDFSDVTLGEKLGTGNFGSVFAGTLHKNKQVAVKSLKAGGSTTIEQFRKEAETMHKLRHPNLVSILAFCEGRHEFFIITERMSKGDLLTLLRSDTDNKITFKTLIEIAIQVDEGMCYMGMEGFVHRDLRAANVLVGDGNISKIADFGLAKYLDNYGCNGEEDYYKAGDEATFPVKWTAPEAARQQKFSVKSDVWSFGILLYEMVTRGNEPYAGMSNHEALDWLDKGNRLKRPTNHHCPLALYNIMRQCWLQNTNERPNFEDIKKDLIEIKMNP